MCIVCFGNLLNTTMSKWRSLECGIMVHYGYPCVCTFYCHSARTTGRLSASLSVITWVSTNVMQWLRGQESKVLEVLWFRGKANVDTGKSASSVSPPPPINIFCLHHSTGSEYIFPGQQMSSIVIVRAYQGKVVLPFNAVTIPSMIQPQAKLYWSLWHSLNFLHGISAHKSKHTQ